MQPDSSQAALQQLQQLQSQSQNPNDILSNQRQQLGVQGAQETVTGLRGAINNTTKLLKQVAPSVMGRTGNSLVTNAQATRQIGNEQAPIQQNLSDQTGQYTQADQDLSQLQQRAQEAASGIYQGQQDKLSYAQNLYNTLYQKEKDAETARQAELARQEDIRRYNEESAYTRQQDAAKASASSGNSYNLSQGSAALPQGMAYKSGSNGTAGFNFNLGGSSISAAKYAQVNGGDLRNLLLNMANNGDKTAGQALQDLQKSSGKWTTDIQKKYPSIFWGV